MKSVCWLEIISVGFNKYIIYIMMLIVYACWMNDVFDGDS